MNMGQCHEFPLNMMRFHSQLDSYIFFGELFFSIRQFSDIENTQYKHDFLGFA